MLFLLVLLSNQSDSIATIFWGSDLCFCSMWTWWATLFLDHFPHISISFLLPRTVGCLWFINSLCGLSVLRLAPTCRLSLEFLSWSSRWFVMGCLKLKVLPHSSQYFLVWVFSICVVVGFWFFMCLPPVLHFIADSGSLQSGDFSFFVFRWSLLSLCVCSYFFLSLTVLDLHLASVHFLVTWFFCTFRICGFWNF